MGGPIGLDVGEEAVLNGIPLGSSEGIMAHAHLHSDSITELFLQFLLSESSSISVAATAVGHDKNSLGVRIGLAAKLDPPPANRVDGEC